MWLAQEPPSQRKMRFAWPPAVVPVHVKLGRRVPMIRLTGVSCCEAVKAIRTTKSRAMQTPMPLARREFACPSLRQNRGYISTGEVKSVADRFAAVKNTRVKDPHDFFTAFLLTKRAAGRTLL